jgi:hypothetical protein
MRNYLQIAAVLLLAITGCSTEPEASKDPGKGFELTLTNLAPSRQGEKYGLWFAFPRVGSMAGKNAVPLHGTLVYKFISLFDVDNDGNIIGLDTANFLERINRDLALTYHVHDTLPRCPLLIGEVTGTTHQGNALLSIAHVEAVGYTFEGLSGAATLASPTYAADDYKGELYLMKAYREDSVKDGLAKLPGLPLSWRYGMWAIDSSTKSLIPFNIFYGRFSGVKGFDSDSADNRYPYPGGRYPADTAQTVTDMTNGHRWYVYVTLEPETGITRPEKPFGAVLLGGNIPAGIGAFTPFELENRSSTLPKGKVVIHR